MNTADSTSRRRPMLAAIAALLLVATLSASCSSEDHQPALTQADATARLEAHFDEAQQAVHGRATFRNDDRLPPYQVIPCDDNDIRRDAPVNVGRSYFIDATVPEEEVIGALRQYWSSKGFKDTDHADSVPVGVISPDGYTFSIAKNAAGLAISGEAPCATRTP